MAEQRINPEVLNTLADMDGERIAERSTFDFPRHFWSSVKNGHYRFAAAGVAIAIPLSAALGAAVCGLLAATGAVASFAAAAPFMIAGFVAAGALTAIEGFGTTGAAAASRASGLAEMHARILDADLQAKQGKATGPVSAYDDKLMYNGRGHHYEFPLDRDKGKIFSWKSGLVGLLGGAASGAIIGLGGAAAEIPAVTSIAGAIGHLAGVAALAGTLTTTFGVAAATAPLLAGAAVAGALAFGALGLYFGVERRVFKSMFNQTDANAVGKLRFSNGPDLGRAQSLESDYALGQHRLRRQEEVSQLEKSYNDRISWGALTGRFKGFAGTVPGAAIGALAGVVALGLMALIPGGAALVIPAALHSMAIPLFTAAGGMLGMTLFSESGTEAGAEATARAIDNEFQRNRALRANGIIPPRPREPESNWVAPKAALACGALGAAAGLALTPVIGPGVIHLMPVLAGASMAGASSLIGGMVGASYGLGNKSLKAMAAPGLFVYEKSYKGMHHANGYGAEHEQEALLRLQPPAPAVNTQITAEEAALLAERLNAGKGKSFAQMTQQLQPAAVTVGV